MVTAGHCDLMQRPAPIARALPMNHSALRQCTSSKSAGELKRRHCSHYSTLLLQCCFTSTETIRLIRDGVPRTADSTFTQLQSSAVSQFEFNVALHPQNP